MITKRIRIFTLLAGLSIYATLYTISAHQIADRWALDQNGKGYWRYAGAITLFPWPTGPGPNDIVLPVIVKMNNIDEFR